MAPMPRPSQLLYPQRVLAPAQPAATVLLLRDAPDGMEVLMTRRSPTASFVPGAYVFPGGSIDATDAAAHAQAARRPTQDDQLLTQAIAAIRESFEELGVLLARHADGSPASAADVAALDRKAPLAPQCAARGLTLAADQVYVLARWITNRNLPRRFDVSFLAARMPEGQTPVADETEQFEPVWVRPADALARQKAGNFFMIFPTIRTLQRLAEWPTVDAVLAACTSEQPLWTSCPRAGKLRGGHAQYMEHEQPYGELELVSPDDQITHTLDWQSEQPVALLKNVQRLTAPNANFMTGPGTNSYLVGDAACGYIVIDPGPAIDEHIQRLWRAAGGDIRMIVCTHSHADHSPGAQPLQQLCSNKPPILGLPSQASANSNHHFTPERALQDGERLTLTGATPQGQISHTLQVIHTPGHAANHLCLLLQEDGLLFSGDQILNGSTPMVSPPDGDMTAYLDSLDKLDAACAQTGVHCILPAHGYVLGNARQSIARLKAHRLAREAKVRAAMQAIPDGNLDDWVALAYDDTPRRIWPLAKRSLHAHVERLRALGQPA
jgi:glyoxylase-like metal-dependent hydrolase (beta-lactamase superfamily II)/8-oxo-dGTP pyrophosphatase MutT (NUDIX family)